MKLTKVLSTAILFLLPVVVVPAYAQEHEQEKKPEQKQEAKPAQKQAKPAQRQQPAKAVKQTQQAQHQQQAKPVQQQRGQQQQRASRGAQTGGAHASVSGHGSIPEAKFRASFGSGHTFHVNRSEFAGGSRRFQYGGFWFNAVDPWPVGWLYTDAVYVDYLNGGYFLCDPVHPGVYISINIG